MLIGLAPQHAAAHAGLVHSDPAPGAMLGATPKQVQLTFSEQPEQSLADIRVLAANGAAQQIGRPKQVSGDTDSLSVAVRRLPRGIYTVSFKVVSAVDGHGTDGTFTFGVRQSPHGAGVSTGTTTPKTSWLELVGRWILLIGLVALIGGAVAGVARFGGSRGSEEGLAAAGWLASVIGLLTLAEAQRSTASTSFADLFDTAVGRALIWRAVALVVAGAALLLAHRRPALRRGALLAAGLAALAAIVVHVDAGHAAAGSWPSGLTVIAQAVHLAAVGVWFGGLAALLLGVRGEPSAAKAAAVRRFAAVALAAFFVVLATGTLRTIDELSSVGQLFSTGYGRAILAMIVVIAVVLAIAARSRRRVPAAETDLGPLRRSSKAELVLALGALLAAAVAGSLAPPVTGQAAAPAGISASGADFGTTVKVDLTTASDQPGPNRFLAAVEDYDSGEPVEGARVSLTFTPLDDPSVEPSSLELRPAPDGTYVGTGSNLAFDGRWRVTALIQRGRDSVEVPLRLNLPFPKWFLTVEAIPTLPVKYTLQAEYGDIRISPHPGRAGPNRVYVSFYGGPFEDIIPIDQLVLTTQSAAGPIRQQSVRRIGAGRFVVPADLEAGPLRIAVVAYRTDGVRIRGALELKIRAR